MGLNFAEYDREHTVYTEAVRRLRRQLEGLLSKTQFIERGFLPNFLFTPQDLVVTIGRDGLVVNTAKYLDGQPIVAVNPDPARIDGVLLPFTADKVRVAVGRVLEEKARYHTITMAEVRLNDGQRLLAFNDFYLGQRTHLSSRYSLTWHGRTEKQSSSGALVVTGAGSTGWFSSTQNMAAAVTRLLLQGRGAGAAADAAGVGRPATGVRGARAVPQQGVGREPGGGIGRSGRGIGVRVADAGGRRDLLRRRGERYAGVQFGVAWRRSGRRSGRRGWLRHSGFPGYRPATSAR